MATEDIQASCTCCSRWFSHSQLRILPRWYPELDCFLTNHFCDECFAEEFNALCLNSAKAGSWQKLIDYCETLNLKDLASNLRDSGHFKEDDDSAI